VLLTYTGQGMPWGLQATSDRLYGYLEFFSLFGSLHSQKNEERGSSLKRSSGIRTHIVMKWRKVARMGEMRHSYKILVGNLNARAWRRKGGRITWRCMIKTWRATEHSNGASALIKGSSSLVTGSPLAFEEGFCLVKLFINSKLQCVAL
jgi:hypothetical protein